MQISISGGFKSIDFNNINSQDIVKSVLTDDRVKNVLKDVCGIKNETMEIIGIWKGLILTCF